MGLVLPILLVLLRHSGTKKMLTPPLSSGYGPWTSIHVQSDGQDEYWNR
jgi:hypothetical protein